MTAGVFVFLIYLGGVNAAPDEIGFWRTVLWPYYAGKSLATTYAFRS